MESTMIDKWAAFNIAKADSKNKFIMVDKNWQITRYWPFLLQNFPCTVYSECFIREYQSD